MGKKYILFLIMGILLFLLASTAGASETGNYLKNKLEEHLQESVSYYTPDSLKFFQVETHRVIIAKEDEHIEERQQEELALYKLKLEDEKKQKLFHALDTILENDGTDKTAAEIQKELNDLLKIEEAAARAAIEKLKERHAKERKSGKIQEETDVLTALIQYTTSKDDIMKTVHTDFLYFEIESETVITANDFLENAAVSSFVKQYENFIGTTDNKWLFSVYLVIFAAFMVGTLIWTGISKQSRSHP